MPKVEITVKLTVDEFRRMLPKELQTLFDDLSSNLTNNSALSEEEAKSIVAQVILDAILSEKER